MTRQEQFLELLLKSSALRFGQFTTKSGRESPYFFNFGCLDDGQVLAEVADIYSEVILRQLGGKPPQVLYGPAYKGIALAVATALAMSATTEAPVGFSFNRKEAKAHGEGGQLVGKTFQGGERVVIIEDVLTGGTSLRESFHFLKPFSVRVEAIVLGIDRQEKGTGIKSAKGEIEDLYGVPVVPILTMDAILRTLVERTFAGKVWIDGSLQKSIAQYRAAYS